MLNHDGVQIETCVELVKTPTSNCSEVGIAFVAKPCPTPKAKPLGYRLLSMIERAMMLLDTRESVNWRLFDGEPDERISGRRPD